MQPTLVNAPKCDEQINEAKIAAALSFWPDLARYASTARIETLTTTLPGDVLARGEVVTVTVFEKKGERE